MHRFSPQSWPDGHGHFLDFEAGKVQPDNRIGIGEVGGVVILDEKLHQSAADYLKSGCRICDLLMSEEGYHLAE